MKVGHFFLPRILMTNLRHIYITLLLLCIFAMMYMANLMPNKTRAKRFQEYEFGKASFDTREHINEVKVQGNRSVFITLPSGVPTEDWRSYNEIVTVTWDYTLISDVLTCCLLYHNGQTKQVVATKTNTTNRYERRYFCDISSANKPLPWKMTLVNKQVNLCTSGLNFTRIFYPVREAGKFAVCTKVVYGKLNPSRLIEWFEYQKMMGVDRIITFFSNSFFDNESRKVFSHYENEGMLTTYDIGTPRKITIDQERRTIDKKTLLWTYRDQKIAAYNCYIKMVGFDIAAILDFDEFIFLRRNDTLKSYFQQNLLNSRKLASMIFKQEYFITDWGKSELNSSLYTRSFFKRTAPLNNAKKYVFVPSRLEPSSVATHFARPIHQYIQVMVPQRRGAIHHYRSLPARLAGREDLGRYNDDRMKRLGAELERRVQNVSSAL